MVSVIKDIMLCHLLKHKLIKKHLHDFLRHFTTAQLLECAGDWTLKLSNKHQIDAAYLDFTNAIESVVYSKLLRKLKFYEFYGLLLERIKE